MQKLSININDTDPLCRKFLFCVYDWFAYITKEDCLWDAYGTSLSKVICEKTINTNSLVTGWTRSVIGNSMTVNTLLYRHYLVTESLDHEIFTTMDYTPLYTIMASMLTDDILFAPLPMTSLWDDLETDPFPINILRIRRLSIRQFVHHLAMREDVTDYRLSKDHALLSSLSLMYGIYLILVILKYEMTIRPNDALGNILHTLLDTLTDLKGVFNNVSFFYIFQPHV